MMRTTFASAAWDRKGKVTCLERLFGRDGCSDSLGEIAGVDRAYGTFAVRPPLTFVNSIK
jgi:hypothetical protein